MIPKVRRSADLRAVIAGFVALLLTALPAGAAGEWDLAQLMELLSHNKSSEARFVERKYIALLDQPVESSGELSYVAPDRLEKRTLRPKPESMVLEGGMLTLERGGRKRSLPLADYPEVGAFVESIRGTLAGDREALQRAYGLALEGDAAQWTLTLTPSEPRMAQIVQKIRIGGSHGEVSSIEILQADGDRSLMSIQKAGRPDKAPAS
ncbi:MAG: outer membrane lipoprotein carrier protein LolA [Sterolibacteriaceae bacterium]|uniref:Outer membrane lipoprotein carrier protein LolA n=1 Tax=Candidatus Methylophosphatis roskildensis TaxID=2899263 RepID=A0A9D7HKE1_9PROT|nr:outer membrane lipoprotein carrier protein LolA [Candidatus Methylophosphatis roskildensis]MBK7234108.1 outer membrane lipoprotein carrier protein LolA [Sterolibacteriaceae bacterium]